MRTLYLDCGMGAAGDMLMSALLELVPDKDKFVEKINNLAFPLAVVKLAKEYGVDLGNIDDYVPKDPYSNEQKLLFKINADATNYYQALLYNKIGVRARNYLDQRQIDRDQVSQ